MIYGDKSLGVIVQNITGRQGMFHTELMNAYARDLGGRGVVAGVAPGKGGREVHGVPVYNTVKEALREHDATRSVVFVPGGAAGDSVMEAAHAGITLAVVITEHIPVHDAMKAIAYARLHDCTVIGPNCPGLLSPGECKLGIMPAHLATRGNVGVVSRSGTLTYEVVDELTETELERIQIALIAIVQRTHRLSVVGWSESQLRQRLMQPDVLFRDLERALEQREVEWSYWEKGDRRASLRRAGCAAGGFPLQEEMSGSAACRRG